MKFIKKYKRLLLQNYVQSITAVLVIVAVAIAGVHLLVSSHALSPYASASAASGTLSSGATIESGNYVQFGFKPTSTLAIHVADGQLVNDSGKAIRLLGVDVSGTEDACIQNQGLSWSASNTVAEDDSSAAALLTWHINVVRIPLNEDCWLNINDAGVNSAYVGANYQTAIKNWVTALNNAGIYTILDLHWSAPGSYTADQQWSMADEDHSPTFWSQVASDFKSDPAVIYDLFNEPYLGTSTNPNASAWSCWLNGCNTTFNATINGAVTTVPYTSAGMQQLVNTVRATGASQPIMVGGLNWSGDPCGLHNTGGNGGVCTEIADMPTDPDSQLAISFHTYGPTWTACTTSTCWDTIAQAAKSAKIPIITGEMGDMDCSDDYINSYTSWADANDVSYLAWSWEVNKNTGCTYGIGGSGATLQLLSDNNGYVTGEPSPISAEAADYKAHLLQVNP